MGAGRIRVLVVHDDEGAQHFLSRLVGRLGHAVATAWTKSQGASLIEAERFEAAILDVHLPDGLGIDLVKPFKLRNPEGRALVVSGSDCLSASALSELAGAPFVPYDLGRIERFLAGGDLDTTRARWQTLHEHQTAYINEVLRRVAGNKSKAARILGVHRQSLQQMLRKLAD